MNIHNFEAVVHNHIYDVGSGATQQRAVKSTCSSDRIAVLNNVFHGNALAPVDLVGTANVVPTGSNITL